MLLKCKPKQTQRCVNDFLHLSSVASVTQHDPKDTQVCQQSEMIPGKLSKPSVQPSHKHTLHLTTRPAPHCLIFLSCCFFQISALKGKVQADSQTRFYFCLVWIICYLEMNHPSCFTTMLHPSRNMYRNSPLHFLLSPLPSSLCLLFFPITPSNCDDRVLLN